MEIDIEEKATVEKNEQHKCLTIYTQHTVVS
jgi:hypothetical protein